MHTPDSGVSPSVGAPARVLQPSAGPVGRRQEGAKCTICSRAIQSDETEYELEFFAPLAGGTATFRLHSRCFAMWEELHAGPWATRTRYDPLPVDA